MYSIGRFASIGRVTVRMLRHWDEIGLLPPAHVDPITGYRSYAAEQLADLAEIARLRDLGVGLVDIGRIRRAGAGHPESRRLLEGAREALRLELSATADRLARFDAHLREAEGAPTMSDSVEVEFRPVPAARVATLTRAAAGFGSQHIGPVVGPLFADVVRRLDAAGVPIGPAVPIYRADESGDGASVLVTAGFELEAEVEAVPGLDVHVLPAIERAAIAVHLGSVETIDRSWMALVDRLKADGEVLSDAAREVYLTPGDRPQSEWVTRLVQPVRA